MLTESSLLTHTECKLFQVALFAVPYKYTDVHHVNLESGPALESAKEEMKRLFSKSEILFPLLVRVSHDRRTRKSSTHLLRRLEIADSGVTRCSSVWRVGCWIQKFLSTYRGYIKSVRCILLIWLHPKMIPCPNLKMPKSDFYIYL